MHLQKAAAGSSLYCYDLLRKLGVKDREHSTRRIEGNPLSSTAEANVVMLTNEWRTLLPNEVYSVAPLCSLEQEALLPANNLIRQELDSPRGALLNMVNVIFTHLGWNAAQIVPDFVWLSRQADAQLFKQIEQTGSIHNQEFNRMAFNLFFLW